MVDSAFAEVSLDDIVDFRNGKAISSARYTPNGIYPVFGSNGQIACTNDVLNLKPAIAIGRVGAYCGCVHYISQASWVTDNAIIAVPKNTNDLRFLFYLLDSLELQRTAIGSAQPLITQGGLKVVRALIPHPNEQRAIARVLGALDDKIELNRRMNRTLEDLASTLFRSWFVDFDPVVAKAAGRAPFGLSPETAALFPSTFTDSTLGPIPQSWKVERIGEVVSCVGGATPSTGEPKFWLGGTHHWATPKDLSSLQFPVLTTTERCITDAGLDRISSGLLPTGTLLLSSRAPVGYLAIATIPVAINQGFIALKCNQRASNYFVLNWCQANMAEIESRATGTTFAEISKQNFRPIPVILPPMELMSAFTATVTPFYAQIIANIQQSHTLAALRDTLLPKLLSGEIRIKEADTTSI